MRKIILYSAISLNGQIAAANGSVEWLESIPNPEKLDYGYSDFHASIDTTIQGYKSYQQILDWEIAFPYRGTKNYVLSRKKDLVDNENAQFITSHHLDKIKELKLQAGKNIWLIGGGQINAMLFNANLIDELRLFVMPIIIPEGIDLFDNKADLKKLTLVDSQAFSTGVVELIYALRV